VQCQSWLGQEKGNYQTDSKKDRYGSQGCHVKCIYGA
jgi:hypothetical protein